MYKQKYRFLSRAAELILSIIHVPSLGKPDRISFIIPASRRHEERLRLCNLQQAAPYTVDGFPSTALCTRPADTARLKHIHGQRTVPSLATGSDTAEAGSRGMQMHRCTRGQCDGAAERLYLGYALRNEWEQLPGNQPSSLKAMRHFTSVTHVTPKQLSC